VVIAAIAVAFGSDKHIIATQLQSEQSCASFVELTQHVNLELFDVLSTMSRVSPPSLMAWSADRTLIATVHATANTDEFVLIWDVATGRLVRTILQRFGVLQIVWSQEGTKLAFNGGDGVNIWRLTATGSLLRNIDVNSEALHTLSWSPDGRYVASVATTAIQILDADEGEIVQNIDVDGRIPDGVAAWGNEGLRWVSEDENDIVRVFENSTDEALFTLPDPHPSQRYVRLSPNGNLLAVSWDEQLIVWNIASGQQEQILDEDVLSFLWSPSERCIAVRVRTEIQGAAHFQLKLWDIISDETQNLSEPEFESSISALSWSSDGSMLTLVNNEDGTLHIWGAAQAN